MAVLLEVRVTADRFVPEDCLEKHESFVILRVQIVNLATDARNKRAFLLMQL